MTNQQERSAPLSATLGWLARYAALALPVGTAVLIGSAGAVAQDQAEPVINVFVTPGDGTTDFVEPDLRDSAADVRKQFKDRKGVAIVDATDQADVVVRILQRYEGRAGGPPRSAAHTAVVVATMTVGDFIREMSASHTASWRGAAGSLVDSMDAWIQENRGRILERRNQPRAEAQAQAPAPARGRRGRRSQQ
jgi:hypothetical protein